MFETVRGHQKQKQILEKQIRTDQVSHAYLFSGTEGTGKKKLAVEFLSEMIASRAAAPEEAARRVTENKHPDFLFVDMQKGSIKISQIRDIISQVTVKPLEAGCRGILIDHADAMTTEAQNALLKTLEEPPENNLFVLVTAHSDRIIPTILSRCEKIPFGGLTMGETNQVLADLNLPPAAEAVTPAQAIRQLEKPEESAQLAKMKTLFHSVISGRKSSVFKLAEICSENPETSELGLRCFSEELHQRMLDSPEMTGSIAVLQSILFELMDNLQYNINLRLQWERCLIKIQTSGVNIDDTISSRRAL
ncbi:MAG: AAA family ATPase [Eubacteriaceae bacterium]|jgi:DNA polymerase-3 subunit delta'